MKLPGTTAIPHLRATRAIDGWRQGGRGERESRRRRGNKELEGRGSHDSGPRHDGGEATAAQEMGRQGNGCAAEVGGGCLTLVGVRI